MIWTVLLAVAAGLVIGLSLGALGGGGSILAVPVLVYLLGQAPAAATTGSLVVVAATAAVGAYAAHRRGEVDVRTGARFGAIAFLGTVLGAKASALVDQDVLLACFAVLMVVVAVLMVVRQVRPHRGPEPRERTSWTPVALGAVGVGLLTGFLGVGGGFLVVPALAIGLGMGMHRAAGTSLLVISITSVSAMAARLWAGVHPDSVPDWALVFTLGGASVLGALLGARVMARTDPRRLAGAFTVLVTATAVFTAAEALPDLLH